MNNQDAEFLQRLLAIFKVEAREHLDLIASKLSQMRSGGQGRQAENIETAFREAHSLKGAARSVNLPEIVTICQAMESVFSAIKREHLEFSNPLADTLQQAVDFGYKMIESEELSATDRTAIRRLTMQLDGIVTGHVALPQKGEPVRPQEKPEAQEVKKTEAVEVSAAASTPPVEIPAPPPSPSTPDTIRIAAERLDSMLLKTEEMIELKLAARHRVSELYELRDTYESWQKESQRQSEKERAGRPGVAGLLSADHLKTLFEAKLATLTRSVENDQRVSSLMIDALLNDMKKALMLPFSSMLPMFSRYVRDLASDTGKKVELVTFGDAIEIDRRVLEDLKDPLTHLVRNSIDHGLETPQERTRGNKPESGSITMGFSSRDNWLEISVADDGRGIAVAKIIDTAVRQGMTSAAAARELDEKQAMQLIFHSGITTSPILTDISGRGLGLAIVQEKVERLNGSVWVESSRETGTTVRMVVPLTMVNFRGTLVDVWGQLFVLPSANVARVARVDKADIKTVENFETMLFEEKPISLVRLGSLLGMREAVSRQPAPETVGQAVILRRGEVCMAFLVTEVLQEQEVLVKSLGSQLARVRNIAGATILGDGKVVPVLNVADLLKSAVKMETRPISPGSVSPERKTSVLVVEDSITARTLMKNILETAAYSVRTAVDGLDAINALKSQDFDIVVSDVEMPRMNGFDLTTRIRADKKLRDLPVVLVTALDSREDKERGIDVGANAYIVKSSFDQSNLLEVIGRLT